MENQTSGTPGRKKYSRYQTSMQMSLELRQRWFSIAEKMGCPKAMALETAIRQLARRKLPPATLKKILDESAVFAD